MQLKIHRRTLAAWKGDLKMFHGLQQGIGLPTDRWLLLAAKPGAKRWSSRWLNLRRNR